MRICLYAPRAAFLDLKASGGDPIYTHNLAAALRARGHEVAECSGLDVRDFWRNRASAWRLVSEAVKIFLQGWRISPDAWLIYSPATAYPDFFIWWQRPKKYVLLFASQGSGKELSRFWRRLFPLAHRRSLACADAITVCRPAVLRHLLRAGVDEGRIKVIPPAPRGWDHVPAKRDARDRLGLPQEQPIILCMARFPKPEKARHGKTAMVLDLLTTLVSLPPEAMLVLVGDNGSGKRLVEAAIVRLGLNARVRLIGPEERVRLFGSHSNEDVKWFYAACDLYAYPHPLDAPWLSLLEAQACGRAVVTLRSESTALIVDDGKTGLLAENLAEFQSHLITLLSNRERCEMMGRNAEHYIAQRHSMELQVRQIESWLLGGEADVAIAGESGLTQIRSLD